MKTTSILFTLTLVLSSLFTSCLQDPQEVIETVIEVCEDEEKLADLKALFNPFHGTIYVTDDFQERAIEGLGLVPIPGTTDELYEYPAFTLGGDLTIAQVKLVLLDLETMQDMAGAVQAELEVLAENESIAAEQLASSQTYSGYRCTSVDVARNTRCHVFPGYSNNSTHYERFLCRRADYNDECSEWMGIIGWSYKYYNQDCSGTPDKSTPITALTCK